MGEIIGICVSSALVLAVFFWLGFVYGTVKEAVRWEKLLRRYTAPDKWAVAGEYEESDEQG